MFCAASKSIEMTSRTIVKFMTITLEANMTFTHNLITYLNFKSVLNMEVRLYKQVPWRIKNIDNYNRLRKEVKSTLLKNTIYSLEEYLRTTLE